MFYSSIVSRPKNLVLLLSLVFFLEKRDTQDGIMYIEHLAWCPSHAHENV
jgi:hypothetical protein